jgi:hypothetical protein
MLPPALPPNTDSDESSWMARSQWADSRIAAVDRVYSPEVIPSVSVASRIGSKEPEMLKLSDEHLKSAERVAQVRAIEAAYRLGDRPLKYLTEQITMEQFQLGKQSL